MFYPDKCGLPSCFPVFQRKYYKYQNLAADGDINNLRLVSRPALHGKFCTVGILVGTGLREGTVRNIIYKYI